MRASRFREYRQPPPVVSGYPLDQYSVSFYKPRAGVNLVSNPSIETGITGYTAVGGAVAQSELKQRYGVYSLEVTPSVSVTSGVYYGTIDLASGQLYFASVYGYFIAGHPYTLYFANTSGTLLGTAYNFRGTGRWQRVSVAYAETSTAARRIYITKNGSATLEPFYIDGLQVEADVLTSYVDGDQEGFVNGQQAYYWTGTAHASTSIRVQATRSGGEEMKLSDYGFSILALVGMGLTGFSNLSTPNAYVGGAQYERTVYTERNFDIVGTFQDSSPSHLQQLRSDLGSILRPNAGIISQPLMLRIQMLDDCGEVRGETVEIPCTLSPSSLAGNWNNYYQDPVTLSFTMYLPYQSAREGFDGTSLGVQQDLASGFLFKRDTSGNWLTIEGLNNDVLVVLPLDNNRILVGGAFTDAGGETDADNLALYDLTTGVWSALNATPLNSFVNSLSLLPDGDTVIVGGNFTNAGGSANADYACYLTLSTGAFSAINATPLNAQVETVRTLNDGTTLIGGAFTNAGGNANADFITLLTGTTYGALNATPLGSSVRAIQQLNNGDVIIAGSFTNAGGDADADYVAYITLSTGAFSALNASPIAIDARDLAIGTDGRLYIARSQGVADTEITSWIGMNAPFVELGSGVNNAVLKLLALRDRTLLLGGDFTEAGGLTMPAQMAGWNGSSYFFLDLIINAAPSAFAEAPDGTLYIGASTSSDGPAAFVNTLTNDGTADTYPVFVFTGPGTVYQLKNYTTGDVLYFNLELNAGETATLTLGPGKISFVSSFRGNIISSILPGSYLATFRIVPGDNTVSAFVAGSTSGDTGLSAYWKVLYHSFDDALYKP